MKLILIIPFVLFSIKASAFGMNTEVTFLGWNDEGSSILMRYYYYAPEGDDSDVYKIFDFKEMKTIPVFSEGEYEGMQALREQKKEVKRYESICISPYLKANEELKKYKFNLQFDSEKCGKVKNLKLTGKLIEDLYSLSNKTIEKKLDLIKFDKIVTGYSKNMINYFIQTDPDTFKAIIYDNNYDKHETIVHIKELHSYD